MEKHPLLKECDVPPNVKQVYLQGCVLAVLERDDGKVTDAARQKITRLGLSLQMSEGDICECITVASGLSTPEVQDEFLGELFPILAGNVYPRYFMKDFETLISGGGALPDGAKETVDYFGSTLMGRADWRRGIAEESPNAECADSAGSKREPSRPELKAQCRVDVAKCARSINLPIMTDGVFIDQYGCVGCGACVAQCPVEAIRARISGGYLIDLNLCVGCGRCKGACPTEAIHDDAFIPDSIVDIFVKQLGVAPRRIAWDARWVDDLGAEPLDAMELIMAFEEEFGVPIPEEDAEKLDTVGKAVLYLMSKDGTLDLQHKFEYIAKDSNGAERRGVLMAKDRNGAIAAVRKMGLFPTAIGEVRE